MSGPMTSFMSVILQVCTFQRSPGRTFLVGSLLLAGVLHHPLAHAMTRMNTSDTSAAAGGEVTATFAMESQHIHVRTSRHGKDPSKSMKTRPEDIRR